MKPPDEIMKNKRIGIRGAGGKEGGIEDRKISVKSDSVPLLMLAGFPSV